MSHFVEHLLARSSLPVAVFDENQAVVRCNPAFARLTGDDAERLVGRGFGELARVEGDDASASESPRPATGASESPRPATGAGAVVRLRFSRAGGGHETVGGHLVELDGGWVWIGERQVITDNELMNELTGLHEQMVNLARELQKRNAQLERARSEIRTLGGLLPICSVCKKVRDDDGYWQKVERYVSARSDARFSHGFCPECFERLYPDEDA